MSFNDRFESLNVTTVGLTNAGSSHADAPAGWVGGVDWVGALDWLGVLGAGAELAPDTGFDVVGFAAGAVVFFTLLAVGRLTGFGHTLTRTHFCPRRRRTTRHFGFGFGLALWVA